MPTLRKKAALDGLQKKQNRNYTPKEQKDNYVVQQREQGQICSLIQGMSRQMPNKRDMIKVGGVPVPKRHRTCIHAARSRLTCIENHPNYLHKYTFMKTLKFVQQIPFKDYQVSSMHMPTTCHLPNKFGNDFLEGDIQYCASFINI